MSRQQLRVIWKRRQTDSGKEQVRKQKEREKEWKQLEWGQKNERQRRCTRAIIKRRKREERDRENERESDGETKKSM